MQFEVIRKSHKKEIIIGISLFIILGVVLIARFTFAKYSLVKSIKIAEGTINYKVPDFKIMAMYKQKEGSTCTEDSCYNEMSENEVMPEDGYTINESKSYCELNGSKDSNAKIYTDDDGNHVISKITKGSRCYLYFDKELCSGIACKTILGNISINEGTPDFRKAAQKTCSDTSTCETTNGLYKAQDDDGTSYYFRGTVENNYVKFANKWWRIIRINGDGSIRLIYDGTSAHANGTSTSDSIVASGAFNKIKDYYSDNIYVGFKYAANQVHGLESKSGMLNYLEIWYTNNLSSYAAKIDTNSGFCGDRTPSTSASSINNLGGTGKTITYYGGYIRLITRRAPVLTCADANDLYTTSSSNKGNKSLIYPIGLITADEVSMAGGTRDVGNLGYYLNNGQEYWTLSPSRYNGENGLILYVYFSGVLGGELVRNEKGIRPVINLRSDTQFTFTGTGEKGSMTNPYIVP